MEEWKQIPGYPEYLISTHGRVLSFSRKNPIVLKFHPTRSGYLQARLYGEKTKMLSLHRLVAFSFLGTPRIGQLVGRVLSFSRKNPIVLKFHPTRSG